jgi:transposase
LNPIERLWERRKGQLKWEVFKDIKQLQEQVSDLLKNLGQEVITSLTEWEHILNALFVAGL